MKTLLKHPSIRLFIYVLLVLIIIGLITRIQGYSQSVDKKFTSWCAENPDTIGYEFIIKADSVIYSNSGMVRETKVVVKYNEFNVEYRSPAKLWKNELKVDNHKYALHAKKRHSKKYLYSRPIIKNKEIDLVNYKKYSLKK